MNEIALRYANALYLLAKEKSKEIDYQEEIKILIKVFHDNPEFKTLLESRFLSLDEKKDILSKTLTNVSLDIINTLKIVIDNNRSSLCEEILYSYNTLVNQERGIKEGFVYSTIPLDEGMMKKITSKTEEAEHSSLYLKNIIDPSLIGGIKVVIGGHVYDGSIKNKLETLRSTLLRKEKQNEN